MNAVGLGLDFQEVSAPESAAGQVSPGFCDSAGKSWSGTAPCSSLLP